MIRFCFRLVLLALLSNPLFAEPEPISEPGYEIEIIIFKYRYASSKVERWPDTGTWLPQKGLHLQPHSLLQSDGPAIDQTSVPTIATKGYELLPPEALWLSDAYARILNSGRLKPVYRIGWQQLSLNPEHAQAITLNQQINYAKDSTQQIDFGTIRLYKTRYLHLDVQLTLANPNAPPQFEQLYEFDLFEDEPTDTRAHIEPQYFQLTESRRLQSLDLHYFDHPMFGAVVQVRQIKLPVPDDNLLGR